MWLIEKDAAVIAETAKELTKERTRKPVVPLMATTSAMLNVLNIGADDRRKATLLTVWKNPKNKKL